MGLGGWLGPRTPFPAFTWFPAIIGTAKPPLAMADGAGAGGVAGLGEEP